MLKADIQNKVWKLISSNFGGGDYDGSKELKGGGLDSLEIVEMIMKLETEFSVEIVDKDAEKLCTVSDVVDLIHKLVREKGDSASPQS